jgi:hypothetical protein
MGHTLEVGWQDWSRSLDEACRGYSPPHGLVSMTTRNELCFLESYARWSFTGSGLIIDLGCWLGATTIVLARGLSQNTLARDHRVAEGIDRFIWESWMTPVAAQLGVRHRYRDGDDFLPDVERSASAYGSLIRLRREDLLSYSPPDEPIEFLFIDAIKSWGLADNIARAFFPRLIPGRSLIVQQDFGYHHPLGATAHLMMWRLRHAFQFVHHVPGSCSVVYASTQRLTPGDIPRMTPKEFKVREVDDAFDYSLRCVSKELWAPVLACKISYMLEQGRGRPALREAEAFARRGLKAAPHVVADVVAIAREHDAAVADAIGGNLAGHGDA